MSATVLRESQIKMAKTDGITAKLLLELQLQAT